MDDRVSDSFRKTQFAQSPLRGGTGMIRDPEVGTHVTNVMAEGSKRPEPLLGPPFPGATDLIGRSEEGREEVSSDADAYRDLGIGQDLGKLVPEKDDRNIEVLLP